MSMGCGTKTVSGGGGGGGENGRHQVMGFGAVLK